MTGSILSVSIISLIFIIFSFLIGSIFIKKQNVIKTYLSWTMCFGSTILMSLFLFTISFLKIFLVTNSTAIFLLIVTEILLLLFYCFQNWQYIIINVKTLKSQFKINLPYVILTLVSISIIILDFSIQNNYWKNMININLSKHFKNLSTLFNTFNEFLNLKPALNPMVLIFYPIIFSIIGISAMDVSISFLFTKDRRIIQVILTSVIWLITILCSILSSVYITIDFLLLLTGISCIYNFLKKSTQDIEKILMASMFMLCSYFWDNVNLYIWLIMAIVFLVILIFKVKKGFITAWIMFIWPYAFILIISIFKSVDLTTSFGLAFFLTKLFFSVILIVLIYESIANGRITKIIDVSIYKLRYLMIIIFIIFIFLLYFLKTGSFPWVDFSNKWKEINMLFWFGKDNANQQNKDIWTTIIYLWFGLNIVLFIATKFVQFSVGFTSSLFFTTLLFILIFNPISLICISAIWSSIDGNPFYAITDGNAYPKVNRIILIQMLIYIVYFLPKIWRRFRVLIIYFRKGNSEKYSGFFRPKIRKFKQPH